MQLINYLQRILAQKEKIVFIINPIAGTKSKFIMAGVIDNYLDHDKYDLHIAHTEKSGHATTLAKKGIDEGATVITAVGGDGTVNEVASTLMHTNVSLGIIPFGSGNGLARHLNIPQRPKAAIAVINEQKSVIIDGGLANNKAFFCTAGIGFDAHVGKVFSQSATRGFNAYVRTVLREFINYKSQKYTILANGKSFEREAFSITFANAGQFGNDAYISPLADIQDGKLDLCIVNKYPKHLGIHLGFRLFNRSMHQSRFVEISKVSEAEVSCSETSYFHLDGEHLELRGKLEIKIIPSCLKVLVHDS